MKKSGNTSPILIRAPGHKGKQAAVETLFSYCLAVYCSLFLSWCPLIVSMPRFPPAPEICSLSLLSPLPGSETMPQKAEGSLWGCARAARGAGRRGPGAAHAQGSREMLTREGGREGCSAHPGLLIIPRSCLSSNSPFDPPAFHLIIGWGFQSLLLGGLGAEGRRCLQTRDNPRGISSAKGMPGTPLTFLSLLWYC